MKSLEHLNDNMSDSDSDVPALVPSSDEEDDVKVIKTNGITYNYILNVRNNPQVTPINKFR